MSTVVNTRPIYKRRFRRKRKKRIIHQQIRIKVDKGVAITFPTQDTGSSEFDVANASIYRASDVLEDSILYNFSTFWGYYQLYGISIEATPTKAVVNHYPSTYVGFLYNDTYNVPAVDQARSLENAFCLPSFGAPTVKKFWYINTPWVARSEPPVGYFWTQSNAVSSANQGPRWEVKLTLYIRLKFFQV